jgi:uncharacterized repeat protein (TIGR04138 family)
MTQKDFDVIVESICKTDKRYDSGAYHFIRQSLDYALKSKATTADSMHQHISAQELLEGTRGFALEQYGCLAITVLKDWGVKSCKDFGSIVFNLVEAGIFGKRDTDHKEDFFKQGYDFQEAFVDPFLPKKPVAKKNVSKPTANDSEATVS